MTAEAKAVEREDGPVLYRGYYLFPIITPQGDGRLIAYCRVLQELPASRADTRAVAQTSVSGTFDEDRAARLAAEQTGRELIDEMEPLDV